MSTNALGRSPAVKVLSTLRAILSWIGIPLILALLVFVLYRQVVWEIEPGTMTYTAIFDEAGNPSKLTQYSIKHMQIVFASGFVAMLTAIPAGILITREGFRDFSGLILGIANIGQTVPSMAILGLSLAFLGIGFQPSLLALWLYSLLPIVRNTATGIDEVDAAIIESARGMGMTKRQILFRIELPLALNVIAAGVRTSLVINVGTAALTTFIGWSSLGRLMATGLRVRRFDMVAVAAVLTAVFAIGLDFILGKVQEALAPRGV